MYIFTCEDGFENMICAIFDAWNKALTVGHNSVSIQKEPVRQLSFWDTYIHTDYDEDKFNRIVDAVHYKISDMAYQYIYYAALSAEEDAYDAAYRFLIQGFKYGRAVTYMYNEPDVARMIAIEKNVSSEVCQFKECARFNAINDRVYVCHLEPRCNVIHLVGEYFADRMPSEYWMIIDDNRRIAVIHPKDEENYMRNLSELEFSTLAESERYNDEYTDMWKTFFNAIAIERRINYKCQLNHFAKWRRKHATEFMK